MEERNELQQWFIREDSISFEAGKILLYICNFATYLQWGYESFESFVSHEVPFELRDVQIAMRMHGWIGNLEKKKVGPYNSSEALRILKDLHKNGCTKLVQIVVYDKNLSCGERIIRDICEGYIGLFIRSRGRITSLLKNIFNDDESNGKNDMFEVLVINE